MPPFETVGVIGKLNDARVAPTLRSVCSHLARRGCSVLVERASAAAVRGHQTRITRDTSRYRTLSDKGNVHASAPARIVSTVNRRPSTKSIVGR